MDPPDMRNDDRALPKVGDLVAGKYRVEKVVGRGGMGVVYAAHHQLLDQRVALKVLIVGTHGDEVIERFVREAQAAARLPSEHVVRVMDAGSLEQGAPFLVMEYLQGCDLDELLRLNGPLAPEDVADYVLQALAALAQAHGAGIIHRDLKPANLFLAVRPDGTNVIKIVDFGISKQPTNAVRWKQLTGETMLGTPAYMSPEQLRDSQGVDPRADIWSLGVVMYELLSGQLPFDGNGPGALFAAILERDPKPLRAHRPSVAADLEAVILRCLQRRAEDRFADVGELAARLAPHGSGRWASLLGGIEQTLARSQPGGEGTEPLVVAARAAAFTSRPPPPLVPPPAGATHSKTLKDDPTLRDTAEVKITFEPAAKEAAPPEAEVSLESESGEAAVELPLDRGQRLRTRGLIGASSAVVIGALLAAGLTFRHPRAAEPLAASVTTPIAPATVTPPADEPVPPPAVPPAPPPPGTPTTELSSPPVEPDPVAPAPPATGSVTVRLEPSSAPPKRARPPGRPSFLRSRD